VDFFVSSSTRYVAASSPARSSSICAWLSLERSRETRLWFNGRFESIGSSSSSIVNGYTLKDVNANALGYAFYSLFGLVRSSRCCCYYYCIDCYCCLLLWNIFLPFFVGGRLYYMDLGLGWSSTSKWSCCRLMFKGIWLISRLLYSMVLSITAGIYTFINWLDVAESNLERLRSWMGLPGWPCWIIMF
jgi:hypothetical protein